MTERGLRAEGERGKCRIDADATPGRGPMTSAGLPGLVAP